MCGDGELRRCRGRGGFGSCAEGKNTHQPGCNHQDYLFHLGFPHFLSGWCGKYLLAWAYPQLQLEFRLAGRFCGQGVWIASAVVKAHHPPIAWGAVAVTENLTENQR
jgi:hypothetical protein